MATFSPPRLRALRNVAGLTRPALAARADLSPLTVTGYEAGKTTPSAAALGRLAAALGCAVDAFYDSGRDERGEYWSAACAALPPLSDETCRAVGLIFQQIDAARAACTDTAGGDDGRSGAA
jgi:transcriptional regulator with XRE-family HTH domain